MLPNHYYISLMKNSILSFVVPEYSKQLQQRGGYLGQLSKNQYGAQKNFDEQGATNSESAELGFKLSGNCGPAAVDKAYGWLSYW